MSETTCVCTAAGGCPEECGDDHYCPHCGGRDIYDPCPTLGSGCGLGYKPGDQKVCDDDCCTAEQWAASVGAP